MKNVNSKPHKHNKADKYTYPFKVKKLIGTNFLCIKGTKKFLDLFKIKLKPSTNKMLRSN